MGSDADAARCAQEVEDTHRRSLVGGPFYVLAYAAVLALAPAARAHWPMWWLGLLVFAALALARLARPPQPGPPQRVWRDRRWVLVLGTAALWGVFAALAHADPDFEPGRLAVIVSTVAFGTAFAHTFPMRRRLATLGIAVLIVPLLLVTWRDPVQRATAWVLTIYAGYLILALRRAHADYVERLDLDAALRAQRDAYARLSTTDPLTGLSNRRRFVEVLAAQREGALLIVDLDHFKAINDRDGHAVGDACLRAFAGRLACAFPDATLARLGGEEFGVVHAGPPELALSQAEALVAALRGEALALEDRCVAVTASIGVAAIDGDGERAFARADAAMYRAKQAGRARVERAAG